MSGFHATDRDPVAFNLMSKRRVKAKARARRNKANHGKKPNLGR